ncbi:regulatory protein GemA [uncultured Endozoicomonas sp.]|uniref:gp16 family protein n=1 Tax=uncultured Endozoicomonas sp. TaxID=432652 RepID=UPI0026367DDA|nr:regulatory protein GemA [uncultured Endozoicomonas sp.]
MPSNNMSKAKARIHIAKKDLAMTEDEYREMLTAQTGKSSCGDMTLGELFKVEHYLKNTMGWKPKTRRTGKKRNSPISRDKEYHQKTMVDKLRALWISMANEGIVRDGSENALEKWVQRMSARYNHGYGIAKVDWLNQSPDVCWQLIECLKQWQQR